MKFQNGMQKNLEIKIVILKIFVKYFLFDIFLVTYLPTTFMAHRFVLNF